MASLTFSHLSSDNFELESEKKAGRKRPRVREPVSCRQCRARKIRCNRERPCRQCLDRTAGPNCTYSQPSTSAITAAASMRNINGDLYSGTDTPQRLQSHGPERGTSPSKSWTGYSNSSSVSAISGQQPPIGWQPGAVQASMARLPPTTNTPRRHSLHGSPKEARMVGVSHWMAPCQEIMVTRAMLSRSGGFEASLNEFALLKERLRRENAAPILRPSLCPSVGRPISAVLSSMLPDRSICEEWIGLYSRGYGRLYSIVDPATSVADLEMVFSDPRSRQIDSPAVPNNVLLLRAVAVVAVAMQTSEAHRLHGRSLGQLAEHFLLSAARIQKPCIGSAQALLLLVLLRTIASSDTDSAHGIASLMSLTTHITLAMDLHRDPSLFTGMPPYYAEQRRRLWAYFLQLNLMYCIRSGTQLNLRLDDSDCPLPTPTVVATEQGMPICDPSDVKARNDASFGYAMAATVNAIAPVYQSLCSVKAPVFISAEKQSEIRNIFSAVVAGLPPNLQPDAAISDPILALQRTLLSVSMHSFLLIMSLSTLPRSETLAAADGSALHAHVLSSQRPQLLEIWDYATSVLGQFRSLYQPDSSRQEDDRAGVRDAQDSSSAASAAAATANAQSMAFHLMWPDASRAALAACLVIGRLRRLDAGRNMPFMALAGQQSASVFHQVLVQELCFLSRLFRSKSHKGPVTAKIGLLLSVTSAVASSLHLHLDSDSIISQGVAAADQAIADLSADLDQRRSLIEILDLTTPASGSRYDCNLSPTEQAGAPCDVPSMSAAYAWTPAVIEDDRLAELSNSPSSSYTTSLDHIPGGGALHGEGTGAMGLDFTSGMSFAYPLSTPPEYPLFTEQNLSAGSAYVEFEVDMF